MCQSCLIDNVHAIAADPDRLGELVSKPACKVRYATLNAGSGFDHSVSISTIGSLTTLRSDSRHGFRAWAEMEITDRLELHFVESGHYHSRAGGVDIAGSAGHGFLLRNVDEHHIVCQPSTRQTCVAIPVERCARLFAVDVDDPDAELTRFSPVADFHAGPLNILQGMSSLLSSADAGTHPLDKAPLAASLLEEAFLATFVETWPQTVSRQAVRSKPRALHIRKAVDWIEAHVAEKIRLEDIAAASGLGVRSMQVGFKQEFGMSPIAYILKIRLQRVHRDLLSEGPNTTIAEIALKWGFTHMGDFAMRYRKLFGRTPTQTRRQALRRQ